MNLKARIAKIEKTMMPTGGFCLCRDAAQRTEIWLADLSAESDTSEPYEHGKIVPDFCDRCRRPIEKRKIVLQLCDRTTKDRFPEQWNAEREKENQ